MNWEAMGAVGEVVGAVAVVISIVYLAMQIKQNTKSTKLAAEKDIGISLAEAFLSNASTTMPAVYVRGCQDLSQLSDDELAQFGFFALGFLRLVQHAYDQRMEGNLSDRSWESIESLAVSHISSPGMQAAWKVRGSTFKRDFQDYVNSLEFDNELITPSDALGLIRSNSEQKN